MKTQICRQCYKEKDLTKEFWYVRKDNKSGFFYICKDCSAHNQRKNRDIISANQKEYRKNNPDKLKKYQRSERYKAYQREYQRSKYKYKKTYSKITDMGEYQIEYGKQYRNNNKEKTKTYLNSKSKYNRYKLLFADNIRNNNNLLEVECKHCKAWFNPTNSQTNNRIQAINGNLRGEYNFYCSDKCKSECEVYAKNPLVLIRNKHEKYYNQTELTFWAEEVKKINNYECEICGRKDKLHSHHIKPKSIYPEEALDTYNGICLCEKCHYERGHSQNGCKISQLKKC